MSEDYVDGDVNRIDDEDTEFDANVAGDSVAVAVLEHIATFIAEEPDAVSVSSSKRGNRLDLSLSVAQRDMGRVIGRRGRTAQAIRSLVAAAGAREGVATSVDIVD